MFKFWERHLDPLDTLLAAVYGTMIVMMFTISVHLFSPTMAAQPTRSDVHSLFGAAVTSAVTWAFIDAVIYLIGSMAERDQTGRFIRTVQKAPSREGAIDEVTYLLGDRLYDVTDDAERTVLAASIVDQLNKRKPHQSGITREDLLASFAMFTAMVAGTLPISVPLLLVPNPDLAVRLSNAVAIATLFVMGYFWARYAGVQPVRTGLVLALVGTGLVFVAILFGG